MTLNELYLQSGASVASPYIDEPAAVFDKAARTVRIDVSGTTSHYYRLRCNLPVLIMNLRLEGGQAILEYQFQ